MGVERRDARLVGEARSRGAALALGEDHDLPPLLQRRAAVAHHFFQRPASALPVDRDRARRLGQPAIKRNAPELLFEYVRGLGQDFVEHDRVPCRLVLRGDDRGAPGDVLGAADLGLDPHHPLEKPPDAARPEGRAAARVEPPVRERRRERHRRDHGEAEEQQVEQRRAEDDHSTTARAGRSRVKRYLAYSPASSAAVPGERHQASTRTRSGNTGCGTTRTPGMAWRNSAAPRGMW